jgi:hypothetical protein
MSFDSFGTFAFGTFEGEAAPPPVPIVSVHRLFMRRSFLGRQYDPSMFTGIGVPPVPIPITPGKSKRQLFVMTTRRFYDLTERKQYVAPKRRIIEILQRTP